MITAVDFIARDVFAELKAPAQDMAAISIGDPAEMPPDNLYRFGKALRLEFLDCDLEGLDKWGFPEEALCTREQVAELVAFVAELQAQPSKHRLVVHCRMGASRSAAVALVVHAMTQCDFPRYEDAHYANTHVVQLAADALGQAIPIPKKLEGDEPHPYLPMKLQI